MSDGAPFEVGQRVRAVGSACRYHWKKIPTGVVTRVDGPRPDQPRDGHPDRTWLFDVRRDCTKNGVSLFWASELEPVPVNEMTLDDTCAALVRAYHAGDPTAALLLADRVMELLGGTRKENAT